MLSGKVVVLRNVRRSDLEQLYANSFNLDKAGDFMPVNLISEVEFNAQFDLDGFWQDFCGKLVIVDSTGNLVGEAGFFKSAHYIDGRELYYRIFAEYRGRGYATETVQLLKRLFYECTNFNRLQALTIWGNHVSEKILLKSGFELEGVLRQARYFNGNLTDLKMFSHLRAYWNKQTMI